MGAFCVQEGCKTTAGAAGSAVPAVVVVILRPGGLGNRSVLRQGLQNFEHSNEVGGVVGGAEFEIESEHQGLAVILGNVS